MSIADFNKDNPFVIVIRKLEIDIYNKVMEMTKLLYVLSISSIIISIIISIIFNNYSSLIFSLLTTLYNVVSWRNIVTKGEFPTVNKLIYGDEFSAINVNNEKLFEIIQSMNTAKGELSNYNNKLYYDIAILSFLIFNSII